MAAQKLIVFSIALSELLSCLCEATETDVIVIGTTVHPGYKRIGGKRSMDCPDSNPWAFNFGLTCCVQFNRISDPTEELMFEDPLEECQPGSVISCPDDDRICTSSSVVAENKLPCPLDHPFSISHGMFCCSNHTRKNDSSLNPTCDGGKLETSDPVQCCLNDDYVICSDGERLCNSTATEILIIRQDIRGPMQVFDYSNYLSLNKDNTSALMYSQLDQLENYRLSTGQFHLKLCYPLLNDTNQPCYEFKQTSHPLDIYNITQDVAGLEILTRPYDNEVINDTFSGLRSDSISFGYSFLDGDKGPNWYNGIATMILHTNNLIPGPTLVIDGIVGFERNTALAELYAVLYN